MGQFCVFDESLRDGLQSPSVRNPSVPEKLEILHLMEALGINFADVGLPSAGPRAFEHSLALAREIGSGPHEDQGQLRGENPRKRHSPDCRAFAEGRGSRRRGAFPGIESHPPVRRGMDGRLYPPHHRARRAVCCVPGTGLVAYVTEDTTRCDPEMIARLYATAISNGASAIVVCDTCGYATPDGAKNLIRFIIEKVVEPSGESIRIDWHGHRDRGLGLANALAALAAGANCAHGCGIGIGERTGNTPMDQLLVNLKAHERGAVGESRT